mgnify:CR=1 FL=1|tara:strand:+ start:2818 stop:4278 length:1461 start_codon:yes stop_codon:yes gene_type:complete
MDLILDLSVSSIRRLHLERLKEILTTTGTTGTTGKGDISTEILQTLPMNNVNYEYLDSLPVDISVCLPATTHGCDGVLTTYLRAGTAYIVSGHQETGSYASVLTMVAYNGHLSVIKTMDDFDDGLYEIVTQIYLSEQIQKIETDLEKVKAEEGTPGPSIVQQNKGGVYKNIKVPKIFFLKRKEFNRPKKHLLDVGMEKARGVQLNLIPTENEKINALAHVCKALWHLQRDYLFMHRDLSGSNVLYENGVVTFIDFGFSCINPKKKSNAWQGPDQTFFKQYSLIKTESSKCTNRSLDLCTLIAHLSYSKIPWFKEEHERMKVELKKVIDASPKEFAKNELLLGDTQTEDDALDKNQYTAFKDKGDWSPGNLLKDENKDFHWWLYNLVEFPIEEWYPENVLTRVLKHIPIRQWFAIRKNWTTTFDASMPKDIRIRAISGEHATKEGVLVQLFRTNQLQIKFDGEINVINVLVGLCVRQKISAFVSKYG